MSSCEAKPAARADKRVAEADERFMRRALDLALRGAGWVNPNPLVGAVIVRDGAIIGEGWHTEFGHLHAEREALAHCEQDPRGATIYVTLEPCCHTGKTPPCTEALIEAGIARVVMGAPDPNPKVAGGGVAQLERAGIEVVRGVLEHECQEVNRAFFHYIQTGTPYATLKYAMTLDGKIATAQGASKWITGAVARRRVHEDRQRAAAIMVGVGTVLADDPLLTCRLDEFSDVEGSYADGWVRPHNPVRVVCDSQLRTPLDARVVKTAREVTTYLVTTVADEGRQAPYVAHGCRMIVTPARDGRVDLADLMAQLGACGLDSVIIEGGSQLAWAALEAHVVSRVHAYVAPKLFGGASAPTPIGGAGVAVPAEAVALGAPAVTRLGDDLLIECEVG